MTGYIVEEQCNSLVLCQERSFFIVSMTPFSLCRNHLLLCIFNMCKEVLGRLPKVVGIDVVEMALWAKVRKMVLVI